MKRPRLQVLVREKEVWLERELDADWMAAYRLHARGETVEVSEVRVLPNETAGRDEEWAASFVIGEPDHVAGRWNAKRTPVPEGGVPAALLRRVTLGHDVRCLDAIIEGLDKGHPRALSRGGFLDLLGFGPFSRGRDKRRGTVGGRGRPALSDVVYADAARRFSEAYRAGNKSPTAEVARQLGLPYATVRGRLATARQRRLLTSANKQGVTGGRLTPRGRAALRGGRRKR